MSEVFFLLLLLAALITIPLVGLVLAIIALVRSRRALREIGTLTERMKTVKNALDRLEQKLSGSAMPQDAPVEQPVEEVVSRAPFPAAAPPAPTEPSAPVAEAPPEPEKEEIAEEKTTAPADELERDFEPAPEAPEKEAPKQAPPREGPPEPPARKPGIEEKIVIRVLVWIGAVALALTGAYLVKYSFDAGWLSPPVRIILGILFGLGLLVVGELLRKKASYISQGCSAAGVADLYACFLAAVNLYHLMPAIVGFGFMALVTAVAVLLSLRQGPLIAVLGLIGGFFTPYWIQTGDPRPGPLFTYLLLLQVALLLVTRRKRWWPLAGLTLLAGMAWVALWLAGTLEPEHAVWIGLFLLSSVAAFLASGFVGEARGAWGGVAVPAGLTWGSMGSGLVLMAWLTGKNDFEPLEWAFLGILGIGCLVLGRKEAAYEGLAWLAAAATAVLFMVWSADVRASESTALLWTGLAMGLVFAGGSYLCLWGAVKPYRWAALSAGSAITFMLLAFAGLEKHRPGFPWGVTCLVLAVVYLAASLPLLKRRESMEGGNEAFAALAVAVTTFVSLAVPIEMEREWLGVAWALEVTALIWISGKLQVPVLKILAWILGGLVFVRLVLNPMVLGYPTGETVLFNWILYGYGLPILAFAAGSYLARRSGDAILGEALEWSSLLMGLYLLGLQVRQYFHTGDLDEGSVLLTEWGALSILWLLLSLCLLLASRRWPLRSLDLGGRLVLLLAICQTYFGQGLLDNPLWVHNAVGHTAFLNRLLPVYGIPALLVILGAWELGRRGGRVLPVISGLSGVGLLFLLVTLLVRQAFQGTYLDGGPTSLAEKYSYSIAWVLFGTVLLILGIWKRYGPLRYASLGILAIAIGKVFLYDTSHLEDLYRVFSFLGLGVCLFLLAFLYQKFFRGESAR